MAEKTISIPFDYNNFVASQRNIWLYSLKKVLDGYIIYSAITIITLAIGIKTELKDPFPLTTIIGCILLIYISIKWHGLYKSKEKFFKRTKNLAKRYEQNAIDGIFVFREDKIEYKDTEKEYRLNWSLFKPYIIFKDYILLKAKDTDTVFFSFGKNEMSSEDYSELCSILKERVGFNEMRK